MDKLNKFFLMEKKYNLFSIKTKQNFPLWDIIRHSIWDRVNSDGKNYKCSSDVKLIKVTFNFKRIITLLKYIILFLFSLFKHHNLLFIGYSRFRNNENKLEDIYFKYLSDVLPTNFKFCFYEVFINKSNYDNTERVYDIIYYLDKLYRKSLIEIEILEKIKNIVDQTFEKNIISVDEIQQILNIFYIEYRLFNFFLRWKKIKGVFLVSSFKGLCLAAKENNIPTFELQHGDIVKSTIQYNYSIDSLTLEKNNFIYPNILLTYSNKWVQSNNLFSECIELGKVNLIRDDVLMLFNHDIAVISSPGHYDILKYYTVNLSKISTEIIVYFKLHPMEQHLFDDTVSFFSTCPNIKVVEGTSNINILYEYCSHFVAIYSSVLYEAYEHQNFIYILKELNYWNYSSFLNLPNVFLISNIDQFEYIYKQNSLKSNKSHDFKYEYYKTFNPNILIQNLNKMINY